METAEAAVARTFINKIVEQPEDPIGGASGSKVRFHVEFLGKFANEQFPYTVPNELVGSAVGTALGLRLPSVQPFRTNGVTIVLTQMVARDPRLQSTPPVTAKVLSEFVQKNPWDVHGAIVFDLFVGNNDRAFGPERRNLFLDEDGRLFLYDLGNCCFYRNRATAGIKAGVARLASLEESLANLFDMDHKANSYWQFLTNSDFVIQWVDRIKQLPDFMLDGIVDSMPQWEKMPTEDERNALKAFLKKRKKYLLDQIRADSKHFPELKWGAA